MFVVVLSYRCLQRCFHLFRDLGSTLPALRFSALHQKLRRHLLCLQPGCCNLSAGCPATSLSRPRHRWVVVSSVVVNLRFKAFKKCSPQDQFSEYPQVALQADQFWFTFSSVEICTRRNVAEVLSGTCFASAYFGPNSSCFWNSLFNEIPQLCFLTFSSKHRSRFSVIYSVALESSGCAQPPFCLKQASFVYSYGEVCEIACFTEMGRLFFSLLLPSFYIQTDECMRAW